MESIYFELKLENISIVGMGIVLNSPDYLHEGHIMEFGKKNVTLFYVIILAEDLNSI